ncbi:MAG: hypothetical protein HYW65_03395 [Candidatus Liptonbacteria bacterium]|nr:hypothetical protein [Candidatus Liptonbacteria bacterium]
MNEEQNNQNKEHKKVTLGLVLGWGLGVLAAISGITLLFSQLLTGILMLLLAAVLLPPANKFVADKLKFSISGGLKFIIVVVLLGIIGATMSVDSVDKTERAEGTPTQQESQPEVSVIKVSAVTLSEEYDANKVAADQKYKGKILEITGVIDSIGKDILDTPYVTLKGRELSLFGVQCMFSKSQENKLAELVKGRTLTVRGKVSGELIGNVIVRDCDF